MKFLLRSVVSLLLIFGALDQAYGTEPAVELKDLGFKPSETKPLPELQKTLEDRRFYLRQHQIWALVTVAALAATITTAGEGDLPPEHAFLAGATVASYSAAAYTALMAPELPHGNEYGGSAWHRRLVWIHLPGMILTPILGYMSAKKIERGESRDGIEKYHKDAAFVTAATLAISAITVSFDF